MLPLHTLMLTSLLASAPALFGVAGLRARPIGHWQHWNWQHFHIGNILIFPIQVIRDLVYCRA